MPGHSAKKSSVEKPSVAARRERLLDEIALERIRMRQAAQTLLNPVRQMDAFRTRASGARHWLYPVAPLLALVAFRLRPSLGALPRMALRGWSLWRIVRRFR